MTPHSRQTVRIVAGALGASAVAGVLLGLGIASVTDQAPARPLAGQLPSAGELSPATAAPASSTGPAATRRVDVAESPTPQTAASARGDTPRVEAASTTPAPVPSSSPATPPATAPAAAPEPTASTPAETVSASPTASSSASAPAVSYENCTDVWERHGGPLLRGEPGYEPRLDGDGDGVACQDDPR